MTRDAVVLSVLVLAFATLVTAHGTIAFGLARRRPGWRALFALALFPLAPLWAWRARMPVRTALWLAAAVSYAVALRLALQ
jgi:hypothetical protein